MAHPRIAVGVAGTATSWQALAWAADEAAATGGHLIICHGSPAESVLGRYPAAVPMAMLKLADPPLARAVAATRARLGGERVTVRIRPEEVGVDGSGPAIAGLESAFGYAAGARLLVVEVRPDLTTPDLVARVRPGPPHPATPAERDRYAAIWRRHSNRLPFWPQSVPAELVPASSPSLARRPRGSSYSSDLDRSPPWARSRRPRTGSCTATPTTPPS